MSLFEYFPDMFLKIQNFDARLVFSHRSLQTGPFPLNINFEFDLYLLIDLFVILDSLTEFLTVTYTVDAFIQANLDEQIRVNSSLSNQDILFIGCSKA